jgi:hypothetical protein
MLSSPANRGTIALGIALVVIGALALLGRAVDLDILGLGWPIFVLLPGIILFGAGVAVGGRAGLGLAIPGGIVSMTGIVLSVQAASGLWATWAYAWALVAPGGVGVALVLYGALTGQGDLVRNGIPVLLTGLGLFVVFGLLFEGLLHLSGERFTLAEPLFAGALVVLGAAILLFALVGRRDGSRAGPDWSGGRDAGQSTDSTR